MPGPVYAFRLGVDDDRPVFVNRLFLSGMEARDERELYEKAGGDFWNFVHPDDRQRVAKICSEAASEPNGCASFECRIITTKGSTLLARVLTRGVREPAFSAASRHSRMTE